MKARSWHRVSCSGMKPNRATFSALFSLCLLLFTAPAVHALIYTFSSSDYGATSQGPWTNSDATARAFDSAASALGSENLITFESAPVGPFTSLTIAPGVTLTGSSVGSLPQTIESTPQGNQGFNTTVGGTQYVYMNGGMLTFTFNTPVNSFGAYFSGMEGYGVAISVNGSLRSVNLNLFGSDAGAGVQFVGFTLTGNSFSSLTLVANDDPIGVDDVRFSTIVPEPTTWTLVALGAGALLGSRRLRRRSS